MQFVWGGYRASYLFFERGESVLYYDIEFSKLLSLEDEEESETGSEDCDKGPLFAKNNVYLPIPTEFTEYFVPTCNPIRLVIRHEILSPETQESLLALE